MAQHIAKLAGRLVAAKYYLKELEQVAMDWIQDQFSGCAADHWQCVAREATRTATTSGIGPNSVLYRALRDMLLAYPATGVKAAILRCKPVNLPWNPKMTVETIQSTVVEYYEAYDRAAGLTRGGADITLVVPEQDWPTRLTEMQAHFPPWATALVTNFPDRFTSMSACWNALVSEASRQADGRKMGTGGRLLQLADSQVTAGDLDCTNEALAYFPCEWDADFDGGSIFEPGRDGGSIFALQSRILGCWRCGDDDHHHRTCPHPASQAEKDGLPVNKWAKTPVARLRPSVAPQRALGGAPPRMPMPPPSVDQVADVDTRLRMDRQDALLEQILARLNTTSQLSTTSSALLGPANFAVNGAATTIAQMVAAVPPPSTMPPLILGGAQPIGYVYVGTNQGLSIWGQTDIVAVSIMDEGASGNAVGM
jgi:hypothetical protein